MGIGRLSRNFEWKEFTKNDTASRMHICNEIVDFEVRDNIKALVDNLLQPLRDVWGGPIFINSGYRCPELNKAVGGVPTSQHTKGQAADCGCTDPLALARLVKRMGLVYDQMIVYPSFVHLSYRADGENRMELHYSSKWRGPKV
jgi:hypothetical protein